MKAFITGSRAYGTPRDGDWATGGSDFDLVVFMSQDDLVKLGEYGYEHGIHWGSGSEHNLSMRFGNLNLIALSNWEDYQLWRDGTEDLKERMPVTRVQAVRTFEALRDFRAETCQREPGISDVGVNTSLYKMVRIPGTRPLWPKEFESLIKPLDDDPNNKAQWGVVADWLDENSEPELAEAFRWVFKRPNVSIVRTGMHGVQFSLGNLPGSVSIHWNTTGFDCKTLPGLAAVLAAALAKAKEDIA